MRIARKNLEDDFKIVWDQVWNEPKNTLKIEYLNAILKTWGLIYSSKFENDIRKWIMAKYSIKSLVLEKKHEELYAEVYQRFKAAKGLPF